ncbi:MBL fold metallo-hydrolase RNA specificity domain-containing protein [Nibribacter koreensis]|uniref:Zn-dependent metallo-hydrolase RNA specificity domain-containing protein n=1 Tax=Nibribacter koreensis TaxID=1084519 RepID=A0ABP8F589_9BACT
MAGYQAEGTRGRDLQEGVKELKIFGKTYRVNAEVFLLEGLSGHADQQELVQWLSDLPAAPKHLFLTHGELAALLGLQQHLKEQLGWESTIPQLLEWVDLPL